MATPEKMPAPVGRTRRHALSRRDKLVVADKDPNYHYRIVNVDKDRVEEFIERGYEVVRGGINTKRIDNPTPLGDQFPVGGDVKAVVMRQRRDYFEEDQKIKQDHIKELEDTMTAKAKAGF